MKEEHIIHTSRANRHHATEAEPAQCSRPEQRAEIWGYSGADATKDREQDGAQRDWPPAVIIGQGCPNERRNTPQDDSRRCRVSGRLGVDADALAEQDERRVDECCVVRAQEGHETDLDEDCPFEPWGPVLRWLVI